MRATLICENEVRRADEPHPRSCNELKPQQRFQQKWDRTLAWSGHAFIAASENVATAAADACVLYALRRSRFIPPQVHVTLTDVWESA
jgi:hypothetical protein